MPAFYPESIKFPKTVKAIMEALIIYTAQILYPELYAKDPISALKRVVVSDLDAGNEFLLRTQANYFESLNFEFPITFYQIDNREFKTNYNQIASRGEIYSFDLKRKVSTFPNGLVVKMITIYNHPDDYMRALTILQDTNASLTRLYSATKFIDYEHNINKILPIPFDVVWEVEKGSYTFKFQEYLKINKLYDVVHTAKINFWDFMLSDYLENLEVNNLLLNMGVLNDAIVKNNELDSSLYINLVKKDMNIYDPIYSSIEEGSTIDTSTSQVIFYFMKSANEVAFENSFFIFPYVAHSFEWDSESESVIVKFDESLTSITNYEIKFAYIYLNTNRIDYYLTFKTGE